MALINSKKKITHILDSHQTQSELAANHFKWLGSTYQTTYQ